MNELEKGVSFTNGDVIRSFSDKELSAIGGMCPLVLSDRFPDIFQDFICRRYDGRKTNIICRKCALEWLKEKADD